MSGPVYSSLRGLNVCTTSMSDMRPGSVNYVELIASSSMAMLAPVNSMRLCSYCGSMHNEVRGCPNCGAPK